MANIAIIFYSMYGHIETLAHELEKGIVKAGGKATLLRIPETLPDNVLQLMHAPPKDEKVAIATVDDLVKYDGILFGIPTRFGMAPAQVKAFMDATGQLWFQRKLVGKPAGIFFSTAAQGGGQETTALTFLTQLTHHGMIYVPMGFTNPKMSDLSEVHGGSAYGPGTLTGSDGSRKPSELELEVTFEYGERFCGVVAALTKGRAVSR